MFFGKWCTFPMFFGKRCTFPMFLRNGAPFQCFFGKRCIFSMFFGKSCTIQSNSTPLAFSTFAGPPIIPTSLLLSLSWQKFVFVHDPKCDTIIQSFQQCCCCRCCLIFKCYSHLTPALYVNSSRSPLAPSTDAGPSSIPSFQHLSSLFPSSLT